MNTNPLTEELYAIDWSKRFDDYDKANATIYDDLDKILTKIEGTIAKTLDVGNLQTVDSLKKYLAKTKANTPEARALNMLIDLRTLTAARTKHLDHTATLCAMQIMGSLWQSITNEHEAAPSQAPKKKAATKTGAAKKPVKSAKPKLQSVPKNTSKPAKKNTPVDTIIEDPTATANVVISNLANHVEKMEAATPPDADSNAKEQDKKEQASAEDDNTPLSVRCAQVANMLAEEYPKYTLTAIRVMTAEKLGVTRQYLENLDIKPKRFQ